MKKSKKILLVLILIMGIGFASVVATLYVNGTATIANADFDVIFTKASLDGTDISSAAISEGGTVITYTTSDLNSAGDQSVLNFTVKNNSPMYDATVSINCTATGENSEYYTVNELIDGEETTTIESMHTKDGTITVALSQVSTETISEEFTCTINASAVERTTVGEVPTLTLNFGEGTTFRPTYFAFGAYSDDLDEEFPTTLTEPPEEHNVYLGMDADGKYGVCINRNGAIHCFEYAKVEYEQSHVQQVFNGENDYCYHDDSDNWEICNAEDYWCTIEDYNVVQCEEYSSNENCYIDNSAGTYMYCY